MKRAGNLFEAIPDRDNLRAAFHKARKGKQARAETRKFAEHLDENLAVIADRLRTSTFQFGRFSQFLIRDPKERVITAPCFEERIAHHAIMNVCEPVFDRWLISDSYACRIGKGRHAAIYRAMQFARRFPFFLKLDIRKYFDSIPHERLLAQLERRFKEPRLLDLFGRLVRSFRREIGRGLPIGSLVSQHFANFYLGWFDRQVKEVWGVPGYVRYMDDVAIWNTDASELKKVLDRGRLWLDEELGLIVKPVPYLNRTIHGMDFLGSRIYRTHATLNRRSRVRFSRKLDALERRYLAGELTSQDLQERAAALVAFTRAAGVSSWSFRRHALKRSRVSAIRLEPGEPWRELEQLRRELPVGVPEQERPDEPEQQPRVPGRLSSAGQTEV